MSDYGSMRSVLIAAAAGVSLGVLLEKSRKCLEEWATKGKSSRQVVQSGSDIFVDRSELEKAVAACLQKVGNFPEDAALIAQVLVAADCRGIPSHGVNRTEMYCAEFKKGLIDPKAYPKIVSESSSTANVDGQNGPGPVVSKFAMELCMKKAKATGIGFVVCRHSNHYGIAGYWAELAQNSGFIAFSFTNTSPIMIPTRALQKSGGTNPIACFCPAGNDDSFQLDMATSTVPLGKIEVCHRKGQRLPSGWGVDKRGHMTTDPAEAMVGGGLTPLGGMEETAGYKGTGLNMMVEILCGVLSGCDKVGPDVPPWRVDRGKQADYGHCFICIDPEKILPKGQFQEKLGAYLTRMRELQPVNRKLPVLVPGDPEKTELASVKKNGVRLNEQVAAGLRNLARELGCAEQLPQAIRDLRAIAVPKSLLVEDLEQKKKKEKEKKEAEAAKTRELTKKKATKPGEPEPVKIPTAIRVTIWKATGLEHMNMAGDNMYCHCKLTSTDGRQHEDPPAFKTETLRDTLNPEWNAVYDLPWHAGTDIYTTGLLFTIYDEGLLNKKTEGQVILAKDQFMPAGFEGTLPIVGCENGKLSIKVEILY